MPVTRSGALNGKYSVYRDQKPVKELSPESSLDSFALLKASTFLGEDVLLNAKQFHLQYARKTSRYSYKNNMQVCEYVSLEDNSHGLSLCDAKRKKDHCDYKTEERRQRMLIVMACNTSFEMEDSELIHKFFIPLIEREFYC